MMRPVTSKLYQKLKSTIGLNAMTKIEELQKIKLELMNKNDWSNQKAVEFIAKTLHRSPATIYEYLSIGRANIPDNSLELLKYKIPSLI